MATQIKIIPIVPFDDGAAAGGKVRRGGLRKTVDKLLKAPCIKDTLGAMSRKDLAAYVTCRLDTEPDYSRYPELEDIYPERVEFLRGFAEGAGCSLQEAAVHSYVSFRHDIDTWTQSLQVLDGPGTAKEGHCSGVLLVGPDGVLGAHSAESTPPVKKPKGYRFRTPPPQAGWRAKKPVAPTELILRKPRTGYIEAWGTASEKGVTCCAGVSCSTHLDEPIEDTWPIGSVPLLRFARDIEHFAQLHQRYTLHNWGRASQVWADARGDGCVVEKSFRRIGIRMLEGSVLWCTEGYFHEPHMHAFQRARRLEFIRRSGRHLGSGDMQYFTDCAVRFTRIGEMCNAPLGLGYEHMNAILTDHAPFPRAMCRHGGPDTAPYDQSVTMQSAFRDLTHNRAFVRKWVPWKKFPCQLPWEVTQYPPHP